MRGIEVDSVIHLHPQARTVPGRQGKALCLLLAKQTLDGQGPPSVLEMREFGGRLRKSAKGTEVAKLKPATRNRLRVERADSPCVKLRL